MYRFTTPTHTFKFQTDPQQFEEIEITYAQGGKVILVKHKEDLTFSNDNNAYFVMTQDESSKFNQNRIAYVQVRVMTKNGSTQKVLASDVKEIKILNVLNESILTGE